MIRQHDGHRLHQQQGHPVSPGPLPWSYGNGARKKDIFIIAFHIPGRNNVSADRELRIFKDLSE
jgi:hypothetical protein